MNDEELLRFIVDWQGGTSDGLDDGTPVDDIFPADGRH